MTDSAASKYEVDYIFKIPLLEIEITKRNLYFHANIIVN